MILRGFLLVAADRWLTFRFLMSVARGRTHRTVHAEPTAGVCGTPRLSWSSIPCGEERSTCGEERSTSVGSSSELDVGAVLALARLTGAAPMAAKRSAAVSRPDLAEIQLNDFVASEKC